MLGKNCGGVVDFTVGKKEKIYIFRKKKEPVGIEVITIRNYKFKKKKQRLAMNLHG